MPTYKIDHDVPPPPDRRKYPWESMKVGDSFFVDCKPHERESRADRAFSSGLKWARRNGVDAKFSVRSERTGIRVWRIA